MFKAGWLSFSCIHHFPSGGSPIWPQTKYTTHRASLSSPSLSCSFFLVDFLVLFIFNWRIVALQYCVGFCHTSTWISHDQLTHWKRLWCWEKLKAKGDEGGRGWDGWMASPTEWTWIWASPGRCWGTGNYRAVVRRVTKSQKQLSDWITTTGLV